MGESMFALANARTKRVHALSKLLALGMLGVLLSTNHGAKARDGVESRSARASMLVQQSPGGLDGQPVAVLSPQLTQLVFALPKASLVRRLNLRLAENTLVPPSSWDVPFAVDVSALLSTGVTLFVLAPSADNRERNA